MCWDFYWGHFKGPGGMHQLFLPVYVHMLFYDITQMLLLLFNMHYMYPWMPVVYPSFFPLLPLCGGW